MSFRDWIISTLNDNENTDIASIMPIGDFSIEIESHWS